MSTVVHFDITAENPENAREFYQRLFDWKFQMIPGGMNYYLIETRDLKGNMGVGGGLAKRDDPKERGIINYIGVESVDKTLDQVKELGGKVIHEKSTLPGFGYAALCSDTDENLFGIFEEDSAS